MPNRRAVLASTAAAVSTTLAGCLNAVSGGLGEEGVSLSGQKREIIETYSDGIDESNAGTTAWNNGIPLLNDEEYGDAVDQFESAVEHFEEAKGIFSEARQGASDIEEEDGARLIADAVERMRLMIEAASAALDAAQAGVNGEDRSTINEHIKTAQAKEEEATSIELRETDVVAAALGNE